MTQDKFSMRNKNKSCNFTYYNPDYIFPHDKVTSTWVVVFDNNKNILVVELDRWFDIPWWHVKHGDKTFEESVKREVLEEAFVSIKNIELCLVVESDYFGKENITYMLFYVAYVDEIYDFVKNEESFSRKFMNIDDFLNVYKWYSELIEKIVKSAIKTCI